MNKLEFIEYTAKRYGFDESLAETLIDMFVDTLQEIVASCQKINNPAASSGVLSE